MRQTDIFDQIRSIVIGASIDASPENYELCHRFVTRSDPNVCADFEAALTQSAPISARAFDEIRAKAGPPRGQIDAATFIGKVDAQLLTMTRTTADALEHAHDYGRTLDAGAADLQALGFGSAAEAVIADLSAQTKAAASRAAALEADLLGASVELANLRNELDRAKVESSSDALTALPNRRAFDSRLLDAITVAQAARQPLSIAFCDVDHFKKFNDTWGHQLGDQVLRFVGSQLAKQFADVGLPARFGGEEFVVLLPALGSAEAYDAIHQFCATVSSRVLRVRSDNREVGAITLSAGIATLRAGEDAASFIQRADAAMYSAKKAGRNRVMFAN